MLRSALCIASLCAMSSAQSTTLSLRWGELDPSSPPDLPAALTASSDTGLWLVQADRLDGALRERIAAAGSRVVSCIPPSAYLMRGGQVASLDGTPGVRALMPWHPLFRVDPGLLDGNGLNVSSAMDCWVLATQRSDVAPLERALEVVGVRVTAPASGRLLRARLGAAQLTELLRRDDVLWVEPVGGPAGLDLDHARIQGGAHHVERLGGYAGQGLRAHSYEWLDPQHPDLAGTPVTLVGPPGLTPYAHGQAVAGVLFARGNSHPRVRGITPEIAEICYTDFRTGVPRDQVLSDLVNLWGCSATSASWGASRSPFYTAVSAALDDAVFEHDITYAQSMSDSGTQQARPEAWSKNVLAVGGVVHGDNADPSDDLPSGSSLGPAADGRIVPTLVGYARDVWTSDQVGAAGYGPLDHFEGFGGTSASAPMVCGYALLAMQMFTDGLFGNTLRNPGGSRHSNRPHFPTVRAMLAASASPYPFGPSRPALRREVQGWGFPNVRALYDARGDVLVVDEEQILVQGSAWSQTLTVRPGAASLRVCLSWAEPGANPAALVTLLNDLDLEVIDPMGMVYRGNGGLDVGTWSVPGTPSDVVNPTECVFVQAPSPGVWAVRVVATTVVVDNHVETPVVDVDFGLAALVGDATPPPRDAVVEVGAGCGAATMGAQGPAVLGGNLALRVSGLPPSTPVAVVLGDDDRAWTTAAGQALPASLGVLGRPACTLYVDPQGNFLRLADALGVTTLSLPVPNLPSLANTEHHVQAFYLDPALGGAAPFSATGALRVHL